MQIRQVRRIRRHKRVRAKIFGTKEKPRLCVFRSNKHIYAQLVDDNKGKILAVASDSELKQKTNPSTTLRVDGERSRTTKSKEKRTKMDVIKEVGKLIAQKAIEKKIEKVVFDRGGYQYHGKVKALADGAREGGLKF